MDDELTFGSMSFVDIRSVWPHEARDFTPWLNDNLQYLSEVIGLDLEQGETEVPVNGFFADILTKSADGTDVVIENQYGYMDDAHLGKALIYMAGLQTRIVIWVAENFTPAYLHTINWLNRHSEELNFLAVQVRVVQIDDSRRVPLFEVIAKPDDWEQRVEQLQIKPSGLSEMGRFNRELWTFYDDRYPGDLDRVYATRTQWALIKEADLYIVLTFLVPKKQAGIYVGFRKGMSHDEFNVHIEAFAPRIRALEWFREADTTFQLYQYLSIDPSDRNNWPRLADWLHEKFLDYKAILSTP